MMQFEMSPIQEQNLLQRFLALPPIAHMFAVGSVFSVGVVISMLLFMLSNPPAVAPPPFSYEPDFVLAEPYEVCPGDTLHYSIAGRLDSDTRRMAFIYGTILDSNNASVWRMALTDVRTVSLDARHGTFGPIRYSPPILVPDLPPGSYQWEHAVAVDGTGVASMYAQFVIPEDCS